MANRKKKRGKSIGVIIAVYAIVIAAAVTLLGVVGWVGIQKQEVALPENPDGDGEKRGSVFVVNNMGLEVFDGKISTALRYAEVINQYAEVLGPDVQVYSLVAPSHCAFAMPEKYSDMTTDQNENITAICDALDGSIKGINVYSALRCHCDEYIYLNTDHHWTALGAYYAYQNFAVAAGFTSLPLEEFEERTIDSDFLGSLYRGTLDASLAANPDRVHYYVPPGSYSMDLYTIASQNDPRTTTMFNETVSESDSYLVFIYGDNPLSVIKNENTNKTGRKIAVVKDSYANAFVPFLAYHYDEVHVIDQRYFSQNLKTYMQENDINEVLVLNNILAANTDVRTDEVEQLLYN